MSVDIESKIEIWKNKLLDLGKRNKLLNYRETKRSTLLFITPEICGFWESFVKNEKALKFPFYDDIKDEEDITLPANVETNQSGKDMQKTLRYLRDKAKTATEEQGINALYLSFGFLEWNESKGSEQFFRSPLILVPVTLTVESISSPYVLSLHEDEILINPTLQYKLDNDFGISLPEFDEDVDLQEYFSSVNALVYHNHWKVVEETGLSLLSFLKINMYNDLAKHRESIIRNPIVRTISGDASASIPIPEEINNYDFDTRTKPIEVFQVVDADSSQQDAILCVKRGLSFILQGPPGTGKSQTITNIISECLADGKKVLFVSEKLFPAGNGKITPRLNNTRKINHVSKEELAEVMMAVLNKCIGATKETLFAETARAYNYNRMTQKIFAAMDSAFELLLQENCIQITEGKVVMI